MNHYFLSYRVHRQTDRQTDTRTPTQTDTHTHTHTQTNMPSKHCHVRPTLALCDQVGFMFMATLNTLLQHRSNVDPTTIVCNPCFYLSSISEKSRTNLLLRGLK